MTNFSFHRKQTPQELLRNCFIYLDKLNGTSQKQIALRYGVSPTRVSQICDSLHTKLPYEYPLIFISKPPFVNDLYIEAINSKIHLLASQGVFLEPKR